MKLTMTPKKMRSVVEGVRKWAEEYARVNRHYSTGLCGLCAITSAKVWEKLKKRGANPMLCLSLRDFSGHIFVECDDYVIDVTATQFGFGKVVVRKIKTAQKVDQWVTAWRWKTIAGLKARQKKDNWPSSQRVL